MHILIIANIDMYKFFLLLLIISVLNVYLKTLVKTSTVFKTGNNEKKQRLFMEKYFVYSLEK
jgi:hypothetical protein